MPGDPGTATRAPAPVLPRVRRARGFRLYDTAGRRYLDLYRDGALLGHRAASTLTAMKAGLSLGLAAALPSAWEARLCAALARLFPAYPVVRLFATRERALAAVSLPGDPWDPALEPVDAAPPPGREAALWRPFLPVPVGARLLLPQLPFTVCGSPVPVCAPAGTVLPGSDPLPGFLLSGALHALAALAGGPARPPLGSPLLERAVDTARGWARTGPYVRAAFSPDVYPRVHGEFLRAGVLLCPVFPGPSILPGECSPGENRLLADLFAGHPGG
jgi:hypothetical protein